MYEAKKNEIKDDEYYLFEPRVPFSSCKSRCIMDPKCLYFYYGSEPGALDIHPEDHTICAYHSDEFGTVSEK